MCGEHVTPNPFANAILGSSPHVRGAPDLLFQVIQGFGIIPACAGSTLLSVLSTGLARDHPRMCGEHHVGHH